jgi:hypothetical protein
LIQFSKLNQIKFFLSPNINKKNDSQLGSSIFNEFKIIFTKRLLKNIFGDKLNSRVYVSQGSRNVVELKCAQLKQFYEKFWPRHVQLRPFITS